MAWIIRCECGTDITGTTDDEIVENAQYHAKNAHSLTITAEQVFALREPAQ